MNAPQEVSELVRTFATNFITEINHSYHATPNTEIVTKVLPGLIRNSLSINDTFRVYGSVGRGNWSEIPWVAILDKSISNSTTKGYYVAILFDKNLRNINLCLSVGWAQFEEEYGAKDGKIKIRETCNYYANLLKTSPQDFSRGLVELHATKNLGKGYEVGCILSKRYSILTLSDEVLLDDIRNLTYTYQELKTVVGDSILNLEVDSSIYDQTIGTFKRTVAEESLSGDIRKSMARLIDIANQEPPEIRMKLKREIVRNRKFSDYVKTEANFICQICGRKPFTQTSGKLYAEADHVTPLGGNTRGLDSPDNMRCLCAQCHAVLTYGSQLEIHGLLEQMLPSKEEAGT